MTDDDWGYTVYEKWVEDEEELDVDPNECESCMEEAEEDGVEYDFSYYVVDGEPYCDHCDRPL